MRHERAPMNPEMAEKTAVWEFFGFATEGYFVEVGAHDPFTLSQTWLLERVGWRGVLVEPLPNKCEALRVERPNSRVYEVAVNSEGKTGEAEFFVKGALSSLERNIKDNRTAYDAVIRVKVVTLDSVLDDAKLPRVDFLSIDTEGTEYDVLKGFSGNRHRPSLIMVEDVVHTLRVHALLRDMGYRLIRRTGFNNWYVPNESPVRVPVIQRVKLFRKMILGTPLRALKFRWEKRKLKGGTGNG